MLLLAMVLILFVVVPYCLPVTSGITRARNGPYENSHMAIVNSTLFHYRVYNSVFQPIRGKIVFVHGLFGSTFSWESIASKLVEHGYFVVLVDLPGFGYSDRDYRYYHRQAHVSKDVWSLLEIIDKGLDTETGGRQWHLAGHSRGGGTVAAMVIQKENRTQSVTLVDGVLFKTSIASILLKFAPLERWYKVILEHTFFKRYGVRTFLSSSYGTEPTEKQIDGYLKPLTLPGTSAAAAGIIKTAKTENANLLASISTPIIAIWGRRDRAIISELDHLKVIRPDVTIRAIDGAAHNPMETHVEEFVQVLLEWL